MLTALLIICIIVVIWLHRWVRIIESEHHMTGLWVTDPKFAADAQIESMEILFDHPTTYGRRAMMIVVNGTPVETTDITYSIIPGQGQFTAYATMGPGKLFPETVTMKFDKYRGALIIYADDTIYGVLYRDNMASIVL